MDIKKQILSALGLDEEINLEYQAKLEDGTIIVSSADSLEAGVDISIMTEDGSTMPMPPGDYTTEDGTSFTVETEGTVKSVGSEEEEPAEEETAKEEKYEEEDKDKMEEPAAEEVKSVITDEVAAAQDEIAIAIDEATGDEVTPEVAEAAAEIAVAIVEEKVEEVAMNKQLKELTEILKTELESMKDKIKEIENTSGGDPVKFNKFTGETSVLQELSAAEYRKLPSRERFFYNLQKRKK
ncbi:MAG: hypothetical protein Unbinned4585contig1001_31 [Prokaryotic dsDNA virus sp.]|nr:MAG: hypothetical protein Unbinned4585contig1001_31 [Prokaryotic dsDNA virus sp.]|tara:strand:- start:383 stop:1099 length:717 start_codon:yes stop_codon:yes gene_type:complete